jgi:uncharacterized protein YebE (UPF0316 family)
MIIETIYLGLITSIIIEVLKLYPVLAESESRKKILAFVVTLGIVAGYTWSTGETSNIQAFLILTLGTTFLTYKAIIQPVKELGRPIITKIKSFEMRS